jgi:hypothetical protein
MAHARVLSVDPAHFLSARPPPALRSGSRAACTACALTTTRAPLFTTQTEQLLLSGSPSRGTHLRAQAHGTWRTTRQRSTREWPPNRTGLYARDDGRRMTTTTTVTRAVRLKPEPSSTACTSSTAYACQRAALLCGERMKRCYSVALRREGRARLTSIPAPTSPCHPGALQPRARPAVANAPRDDAWLSRRHHRRPQSTASLSGSAVLREPVILDLHGSLLHRPAPRCALRLVGPYLAAAFPADAPAAVHGLLSPEARRGSGWTW